MSRPHRWSYRLRIVILALSFTCIAPAQAAPLSNTFDPWKKWQRHDPSSTKHIDHNIWENFLSTYQTQARNIRRIRYRAVTTHHRNQLYDYLWLLSKQNIETYNRREQLAFWLNLYNATVVKMILEHYPISTLDEIKTPANLVNPPTRFKHRALDTQRIHINHTSLSLNDIKHRILLSVWQDPRLLYALSDGTLGAPSIPEHAFSAENLERQLSQAAHNFINAQRALKITHHQLMASRVFQQYIEHFGQTELDLLKHLQQYAAPSLSARLKAFHKISAYVTNDHINDAIYTKPNQTDSSEDRLPEIGEENMEPMLASLTKTVATFNSKNV